MGHFFYILLSYYLIAVAAVVLLWWHPVGLLLAVGVAKDLLFGLLWWKSDQVLFVKSAYWGRVFYANTEAVLLTWALMPGTGSYQQNLPVLGALVLLGVLLVHVWRPFSVRLGARKRGGSRLAEDKDINSRELSGKLWIVGFTDAIGVVALAGGALTALAGCIWMGLPLVVYGLGNMTISVNYLNDEHRQMAVILRTVLLATLGLLYHMVRAVPL